MNISSMKQEDHVKVDIYYNADWQEYACKLSRKVCQPDGSIKWVYAGEEFDYFTDDKEDAKDTASKMAGHGAEF